MGFDAPIADSEGLHPVANTEKDPRDADIVFVHGLAGASHSTWRFGHFFWPAALGEDLPQCGIWTVGYPAGITAIGKPGMIIDKRSGNLAQKLANAGLGTRPLLFITHSMGGLVVKSLIVGSQTLADADRKQLVSVVRGIVFLGTPHRGSAFADAARVLSAFVGGSQEHVDEMRRNAEPLDILHDEFIDWHRRNPVSVESYAENIQLFRTRRFLPRLPLGLVVPRASANPGIAGHTVRDVDDDHLTLVKPRDRKHDVYAGVLRFVRDVLASKSGQDLVTTPVPRFRAVPATDGQAEAGAAGVIARPRVYLSYTLRTKDLRDGVFELAERLRRNGIDSRMDLFYAKSLYGFTPPDPVPHQDSWAVWQEEQVPQADCVLVLCSKEFNESPEGSGAWFDVELMKRDVESGAALRKFIPVGFGGYESNRPFIPSFILGATYYDLTPGPIAGLGFEDLLRRFRTEFSSTSAAGDLGRVHRTTPTSQAQPPPSAPDVNDRAPRVLASGNYDLALETRTASLTPGDTRESVVTAPAFDLERQGEVLKQPAAEPTLSAPAARVVWKPVPNGLVIEVTNMQPRVMRHVQLILKDALWWSEEIGAFVELRDAYGVDEFEMGTAGELFSGVPTTFSGLRSIPGDPAIRVYGPVTLKDFFEAPVKLRLAQQGRWSVGLHLKWDDGTYDQRLEFDWDGNVAVPFAARTAIDTAVDKTAPLPSSDLRELYLAGIRAQTEGDLERTIELWQRILEQDSQFQGGSLTTQLERIRRQFHPTQMQRLRERARNARNAGAWAEEIGAWQALLGVEAADQEARASIPIAEANQRHAWMYESASQLLREGLLPDARTQLDILWQQHPDYGDPAGLAQQADFVRLRLRSSSGRYTYLTSNGRERKKDVYLTVVSQDLQGNLTAHLGHSHIGARYLCTGTIEDDGRIVLQGKHEQEPQQIAFEGNIRPDGRGHGTIEISTHEAKINTGKWEIDGLVNSQGPSPAAL